MEALGIDIKILLAQIVNFGLLFFLLSKLLYKPLGGLMADRTQKIEKGLKDAEEAAVNKSQSQEKAEAILAKAEAEATKLLQTAKTEATAESTAIMKKASEQADKIMARAREEAESAKSKAMTDAKKEIADVVVIALSKITKDELSDEQKKNLTSKAISEI